MKIKFPIDDKLSTKQLDKWEFLKSQQFGSKKVSKKNLSITISRETGSGGRLIAKKVAKKLNFKYYDKEIVNLIVKEANKRKELIQSLDEKSLSFIEETLGALFGAKTVSSSIYFRYLIKVILALAEKDNCVILGRGANFIVSSEYSLRISVIAPLKTRIEKTIEFEGKTEKQAKGDIERVHFNRKEFIKKYFRKNISDANYYDLVINTENLSVDQAAEIIVKLFKKRFPNF